jgi:hypothetical protein
MTKINVNPNNIFRWKKIKENFNLFEKDLEELNYDKF